MEELDRRAITISAHNCTKLSTYKDSNDKIRNDTSYINYSMDVPIKCNEDEEFRVTTSYVALPLSFYNINKYNNKIMITGHSVSAVNGLYTITSGYYTADELATALNNSDTTATQRVTNGSVEFGDYFTVEYKTQLNVYYFKCTTSTTNITFTLNTNAYALLGLPVNESMLMTEKSSYYYQTFSINRTTVTLSNSNAYLVISGHSNSSYNGTYGISSTYYGTITTATFILAIKNAVNNHGIILKNAFDITSVEDTDTNVYTITFNSISTTQPYFGHSTLMLQFVSGDDHTNYYFTLSDTYYELYSSASVNLNYSNVFHVVSNRLGTSNMSSCGTDVLVTVYTAETAPATVIYQSYDEIKLRSKVIDSFDLQIRDQNFNIVDLNGISWTITLLLKKYKKQISENDLDFNNLNINNKRNLKNYSENIKRQKV